jgi:hypothetical protein
LFLCVEANYIRKKVKKPFYIFIADLQKAHEAIFRIESRWPVGEVPEVFKKSRNVRNENGFKYHRHPNKEQEHGHLQK